jgi:hypothetical protein
LTVFAIFHPIQTHTDTKLKGPKKTPSEAGTTPFRPQTQKPTTKTLFYVDIKRPCRYNGDKLRAKKELACRDDVKSNPGRMAIRVIAVQRKIMMKKAVLMILAVVLFALTIYLSGCSQPGETVAEGHRRHIRNLKLNQQSLTQDVDSLMLFEKPSRLSDMKIE